jgi:hypothetical protein
VGFRISWIGFDGKGRTSALEMVGLRDTGEPDEANEAPFSGAEIPGGWFILFSHDFQFASRERLAQLSIDCRMPVRCMKGLCSARLMATNVEIACGTWRTMRNKASTICRSLDRRRRRMNQFASV